MRMADRLNSVPPYLFGEISRLKAKALSEGRELIDLGIGDPDQPTPAPIVEALGRAAHDPLTHRYDESPFGWPPFLAEVQRWFGRRFGVELSPDGEILHLIGSKEGLTHLPWAVANPGETVLVPDPAYSAYAAASAISGARVVKFRLKKERGWLPDFSEIAPEDARSATLMYVNYPNNPTGGTATLEFYREAVEFARQYDIILCSDSAYSEVTYDGYVAPSVLQTPGAQDVAVEFHSLSKSFNMTGWRVGFAVGNRDVLQALSKLKGNLDSKQFPAVDEAAVTALRDGDNSASIGLFGRRLDILVDGLNSLGWKLRKPRGTFYLWVDCPPGMTSVEFSKALLEKAGVLAIPGVGYGDGGEGYVRMSVTVCGDRNGEMLARAVERIGRNLPIHW